MNWDDLRYFLELARSGRLSHAGEKLGVDHSTVARRIEQLERNVGTRLFESDRRGFRLSDSGHRFLAHAESIENQLDLAREDASGEQSALGGVVRVGTPEGFATRILTPRLGALLEAHPALQVEILAMPRFSSLASHETDLLVTLDPPSSGRYVVKPLTDFSYGLFGARCYLDSRPPIRSKEDLAHCDFVGYVDDFLPSPQLRYLDELAGRGRIRMGSTGMLAQVEAVRAGLGLGVLAHYLAHGQGFVQLLPGLAHWPRKFWIVTHVDRFRLRRVQAVWNHIRKIAETEQQIFGMPASAG